MVLKKTAAKAANIPTLLASAKNGKQLVEIWRDPKLTRSSLIGYVIDYKPKGCVIVHKMSDDIFLDGYVVIRVADIARIDIDPKRRDFYSKVLKKRGDKRRPPKGVHLVDLKAVLRSVNSRFPIFSIYREKNSRGCSVGRIESLSNRNVRIYWLTPGAEWDGLSPYYRLSDITKISFGGAYENALAMVATRLRRT